MFLFPPWGGQGGVIKLFLNGLVCPHETWRRTPPYPPQGGSARLLLSKESQYSLTNYPIHLNILL